MAEKWTRINVGLHGFLTPIEYGVPGIPSRVIADTRLLATPTSCRRVASPPKNAVTYSRSVAYM